MKMTPEHENDYSSLHVGLRISGYVYTPHSKTQRLVLTPMLKVPPAWVGMLVPLTFLPPIPRVVRPFTHSLQIARAALQPTHPSSAAIRLE